MQLLKPITVIALTAGIAGFLFPWWMIAACAFVVCVNMRLGAGKSFVAGFLGIVLAWLAILLWRDIPNEHILSAKMATIILGSPNSFLFILITILLGGLVGGLSGLSGGMMNRAFRK